MDGLFTAAGPSRTLADEVLRDLERDADEQPALLRQGEILQLDAVAVERRLEALVAVEELRNVERECAQVEPKLLIGEAYVQRIPGEYVSKRVDFDIGVEARAVVGLLVAQKRLVEAGLGVALVPRSAVTDELRAGRLVVIRAPRVATRIPICVVHRKRAVLSAAARALLAQLSAAAWSAE